MNLLGYHKFESAEVGFNQEEGYLYLNYFKESTSDDFRALWHYIFELTEKYPHNKTFINQRKQNVYPADQKWLANEFALTAQERFPWILKTPRYVAILVAENFYIEYTTTEYIDSKKSPHSTIQMFRDQSEAITWLLSH